MPNNIIVMIAALLSLGIGVAVFWLLIRKWNRFWDKKLARNTEKNEEIDNQ